MNVLVLGGTQFLGRHIVDALSRDGHHVTRFHRGRTNADAPVNTYDRFGDRNEELTPVAGDLWDVVIDVNAYEPHQVERSVKLRTSQYVFVSTVSVYGDLSTPGIDEHAATIEDLPDDSNAALRYGANKAACERIVRQAFPDAAILRPGLIVGPYDPTDRFTYWCERALRGGTFVAPEPRDQRVQFIDARDIAGFVASILEHRISGTFNLVGPREQLTMQSFIEGVERVARSFGVDDLSPLWIDRSTLLSAGVQPWTDLPLWLPMETHAGMIAVDNRKARDGGLTLRPAHETLRATMEWVQTLPQTRERKAGLSRDREAELIAAVSNLH